MKRIFPFAACFFCLGFSAAAAAAPQLWVSELSAIQKIDTATDQVVAGIVVTLPPNTILGPAWQAPNGGPLYAGIDNDNEIYEIDPGSGQTLGSITLANPDFGFFAPSHDGKRLYVGLIGDSGHGSTASFQAFRLNNDNQTAEIDAGEEWFPNAVGPSDQRIYAGSRDANHVYVMDRAGHELAKWDIGTDPLCDPATVTLSADGNRAYVACRGSSPNFEVIRTATGAVIKSVDVGLSDLLWAMPAPDGDIWVFGLAGGGTLYDFDSSYTLKQTVPLGLDLLNYAGMAVSPDGTRFYLADASPDRGQFAVDVYDVSTLQKVDTIPLPGLPFIGFHSLTHGSFHARDQALATGVGEQLSGTLAVANSTGCSATFAALEQPAHGSLDLDAATGDFVYTPAAGFTGRDVFTWRATAPDSCTAADNPTLPQTNVAAVAVSVDAAGGGTSAKVGIGATQTVDVKAQGVGPWSAKATSAATGIVRVSSASCPSATGDTTCKVTLRGVAAGSTQVQVTLDDAYGGSVGRPISVTAQKSTGSGSGSGGGGAFGGASLALLGLLAVRRRRRG